MQRPSTSSTVLISRSNASSSQVINVFSLFDWLFSPDGARESPVVSLSRNEEVSDMSQLVAEDLEEGDGNDEK